MSWSLFSGGCHPAWLRACSIVCCWRLTCGSPGWLPAHICPKIHCWTKDTCLCWDASSRLLLGVACYSLIPPLTDLCCGLIVCNKPLIPELNMAGFPLSPIPGFSPGLTSGPQDKHTHFCVLLAAGLTPDSYSGAPRSLWHGDDSWVLSRELLPHVPVLRAVEQP